MKITVMRAWQENGVGETMEVTIDAPVTTVDEAIAWAVQLAEALATDAEEMKDIEVIPAQTGVEAAAAGRSRAAYSPDTALIFNVQAMGAFAAD